MGFKDLSGQADLHRALAGALAGGTFCHAVLLTGPEGSGKRTWGRALAMALLCPERQEAEPCGSCLSCRQLQSGNHPRYFYLEPRSPRLKIDQIREVRGSFYYEGENKVCLVNRADRMTAEASSSLLKILEEPPPGLFFILLAEQARQIFSTVLSRCRHFSLQPLSTVEIKDILKQKDVPPEQASLIARLSMGLPGRALALAGDAAFEQRLQEAASLARRWSAETVEIRDLLSVAAELAERDDLPPLLELVYLFYRDALILSLCGNKALLVNPEQAGLWPGDSSPLSLEQAMGMVHATLREIRTTNINRRLALEGLLIMLKRSFAQCPE